VNPAIARIAALIPFGLASAALAQGDPLALAGEAYAQGHYREARDLARKATQGRPAQAWRTVGSASCMLKDRASALEALGHLPGREDADVVRFACDKAGMPITDEDARLAASPARREVEAAQSAYSAGKYPEAKKAALAATAADPKLAQGWRLLGAAACWTKDKKTAEASCEHLQPVDQEFVRAVCARTLGALKKDPRVLH
jgi:hypothetical protein